MSLENQIYTISSDDPLNASGEYYDFNYTIKGDLSKYNRVCVLGCNIPFSYYMIDAPYNTFTLNENGSSVLITVPVGNYNFRSYATVIKNLLNTNSPNGYTYNIITSNNISEPETGKYLITCSELVSPVSLIFNNSDDVQNLLGFEAGTKTFVGGQLTSEVICDFIPVSHFFIHSSLNLQKQNDEDADTICEIYAQNNNPFSDINYINVSPQFNNRRVDCSNMTNVTPVRFTLQDYRGRYIRLNKPFTFTICFYKADETNELLKRLLLLQISKLIEK